MMSPKLLGRLVLVVSLLLATSPVVAPAAMAQSQEDLAFGQDEANRVRSDDVLDQVRAIADKYLPRLRDAGVEVMGILATSYIVLRITKNPLLAGGAGAVATILVVRNSIAGDIDPREIRPLAVGDLPTSFSGVANGAIPYSGSRNGSSIRGSYSTGGFGGTVNPSLHVFGRYRDVDGSAGVFSGTVTPMLDQAFGSATCTSNCD